MEQEVIAPQETQVETIEVEEFDDYNWYNEQSF